MTDKQKTPEQLANENEQLQKALAAANKRAEKAEKSAGMVDGLKEKLEQATAELKVAEATKAKNAKPVVKVGNDHYVVRSGVIGPNGQAISREDLAKDTKLCAKMIAGGSSIFKKVQTK